MTTTLTATKSEAIRDHEERIARHNRILDEEKAKAANTEALIMTYTLTAQPNIIIRDEDQAFIPTDPDNTDYQAFLKWVEEGNEPTPYTPPPAVEGESHG